MAYRYRLVGIIAIIGALSVAAFVGCSKPASEQRWSLEECNPAPVDGLMISLRDSQGYPIADATVTARDGDYVETLESNGDGRYHGAVDRAGSYIVLIKSPYYDDTEIGPIDVEMGDCHVRTQRRSIEFFP